MSIRPLCLAAAIALCLTACQMPDRAPSAYDQAKADLTGTALVADIQAHMQAGKYTSADLTKAALDQIKAKNGKLHAVITVNPDALTRAKESDEARKAG